MSRSLASKKSMRPPQAAVAAAEAILRQPRAARRPRRRNPPRVSRLDRSRANLSRRADNTKLASVLKRLHPKLGDPVRKYIATLEDPWNSAPIRLGYGNFAPTALKAAWFKGGLTIGATHAAGLITLLPRFFGQYSGGTTGFESPSFMNFLSADSSGSALASTASAAVVKYKQDCSNYTTLAPSFAGARVVSAALRVSIRYSSNCCRGNLFGNFFSDIAWANSTATNGIYGMSPAVLYTLPCTKSALSGGDQIVTIEVQFRPSGPDSFTFWNSFTSASTSDLSGFNFPYMTVGWSGWTPGQYQVEYASMVHIEADAGLDVAADDNDADTGTVADSGMTIDQLGPIVMESSPIVAAPTAIEVLDTAFENIRRSERRTGFGGGGGPRRYATAPASAACSSSSPPAPATERLPDDRPSLQRHDTGYVYMSSREPRPF